SKTKQRDPIRAFLPDRSPYLYAPAGCRRVAQLTFGRQFENINESSGGYACRLDKKLRLFKRIVAHRIATITSWECPECIDAFAETIREIIRQRDHHADRAAKK